MRRLVLALTLAFALPASAGITGRMSGEQVVLQLNPSPAISAHKASLFVGLFAVANGQPNLSLGGWFDGQRWRVTGMPVAAFTGRFGRQSATVPVPGGVCGMVRKANGPSGTYAIFAGWGRADAPGGDLDEASVEKMIESSSPKAAAKLRALLADYRAAEQRSAKYAGNDSVAFTDMRAKQSFWLIALFQCDRGVSAPDKDVGPGWSMER